MSVKKIGLALVMMGAMLGGSVASAQENIKEGTVKIAVASNFLATLKALSEEFTKETGIKVEISNGATGMLYAQIKQGAPYDMLFAADAERPKMLAEEGYAESDTRFTYVTGKLVAWSPEPEKVSADLSILKADNPNLQFLAMANPKVAPYGAAAEIVLNHYGLYDELRALNKIVQGENIGKTYHYAATRSAQIGMVAKSYVSNPDKPVGGEYFEIDSALYPPLVQDAVVLTGRNGAETQAFLKFFDSDKARQHIEAYGYGLGAKRF